MKQTATRTSALPELRDFAANPTASPYYVKTALPRFVTQGESAARTWRRLHPGGAGAHRKHGRGTAAQRFRFAHPELHPA